MTPPYFHDGSVASLPTAVRIMAKVQFGTVLSEDDTRDIVAFLASLTGALPNQFAKTPILPPSALAIGDATSQPKNCRRSTPIGGSGYPLPDWVHTCKSVWTASSRTYTRAHH